MNHASAIVGWMLGAGVLVAVACSGDAETGTDPSTTGQSASSTGAGAGGGTSSSSSTGTSMITCPGTYTTVPEGECSQLQQDCQPGFGCKPAQDGASWTTQCVPSSGLKGPKKPCATDAECQPGLFCVFGQCTPVCCPTTSEPCNGGTCNVEAPFGPYTTFLCSFLEKCDILTENACARGTDCHIQDFDQGLSVCVPPSGANKQEGEPCNYLNDCGPMQLCFNMVCRWNCYVSAMGQGMPGLGGCPKMPVVEKCTQSDFGIDDVGVCLP